MKYLLVLCFVMVASTAYARYTNKYDDANVLDIMKNKRLLRKYFECVMERGPCTADGKELRNHIRDAMETGCTKCSVVQEQKAVQVIKYLIKHELAMWKQLTAKFDPTGVWRQKYEDTIAVLSLLS